MVACLLGLRKASQARANGADPDAVDYANLTGLVTDWRGAALVTRRLFDAWNRTPGPNADTHLTSMLNWYRGIVPLLFTSLPDFHVNVPTLVLWGRRDVVLVEANVDLGTHPAYPGVRTLNEFIPDLEDRTFADAGHFLQHEETIEVARAIKQFVDAVFARLAAHVGAPPS
jgi:pimeloyl-ACP methyl ester carboxylesterase